MTCTFLQISLLVLCAVSNVSFLLCRSKPHPGGKMPSQGEDLAILSLCNNSIIGVRQFRQAEGQEGDEVGCTCSLSVLVVNSGILGYRTSEKKRSQVKRTVKKRSGCFGPDRNYF